MREPFLDADLRGFTRTNADRAESDRLSSLSGVIPAQARIHIDLAFRARKQNGFPLAREMTPFFYTMALQFRCSLYPHLSALIRVIRVQTALPGKVQRPILHPPRLTAAEPLSKNPPENARARSAPGTA